MSDCGDSIRQSSRQVQPGQNFLTKNCPKGHDYEGIAACDNEPWGAYSIGAIYDAAMAMGAISKTEKAILEIGALDNFSRLMFDHEDMLKGKLGEPDMSSSGISRK